VSRASRIHEIPQTYQYVPEKKIRNKWVESIPEEQYPETAQI
jgi:hypothetical protein